MHLIPAYATLFALSFLAATAIPMSSEPPLIYLVRTERIILLPVIVGTVGNVLGACTTYWIAARATRAIAKRKKPTRGQAHAAELLRRYGQPSLVLSWVPILGDALVALAGAARMPFWGFCFWVTIGKGARYLIIALATLNFF